ncbi:MAG: hypothetical protein C5B60_09100 [Chloroflexi bacterium]|nr:MAG: hypothetical protein C5B60_09100 [Chloroflexota bacterium]
MTWEQRPRQLKSEELNAWALTTITDALSGIADVLGGIESAIHGLGTGDAGTTMGAIEFLACKIHDGFHDLALAFEAASLQHRK